MITNRIIKFKDILNKKIELKSTGDITRCGKNNIERQTEILKGKQLLTVFKFMIVTKSDGKAKCEDRQDKYFFKAQKETKEKSKNWFIKC